MTQACILKPDTKGRITLGKLAKGVSSFHVIVNSKKGQIILEPYTEIPLKESWLFNNKKALIQLNNGIKDSAKGQVKFIETDIVIARSEATRQSRKIIKNSVNQNF